jgi:TatA/E family protein of Tat protein translocase
VAVLLFGSKRIPEVGRSLGAGLRSFQEGVTGTTATPVEPASDSTSGETQ